MKVVQAVRETSYPAPQAAQLSELFEEASHVDAATAMLAAMDQHPELLKQYSAVFLKCCITVHRGAARPSSSRKGRWEWLLPA